MVEYKPQALDISDVGQVGLGGGPAMQAHYIGLARRNPHLLAGFAQGERGQARDILNRAYSENADVNQMLNQLAQGEQINEARKNELGFAGDLVKGFSSDAYRRSIGDVAAHFGYPDLGAQLFNEGMVGDVSNLDLNEASAYNKRVAADALMRKAKADEVSAGLEGSITSEVSIDPFTNLPTLSYKQKGGPPVTLEDWAAAGLQFGSTGEVGTPPDAAGTPIGEIKAAGTGKEFITKSSRNGRQYSIKPLPNGDVEVRDVETGELVEE